VSDPAREAMDQAIAKGQEARRRGLRRALLRFIEQFDYATVRKELAEAKREHAEGLLRERALREQAETNDSERRAARAQRVSSATLERLQHIWIAVESVRATQPGMTIRDACRELEKGGGIAALASADQLLGTGVLVRSGIPGASTIEREFKRAQQLLRADRDPDGKPRGTAKVWQNMLNDLIGKPRLPEETGREWRGKTSEK
jgi:hypothetical protein